jgi:hypothetical protein
MGSGNLEFEVDAGQTSYAGKVIVDFYMAPNYRFPPTTLYGVPAAGSALAWHKVPQGDIGASAAPTSCTAHAV